MSTDHSNPRADIFLSPTPPEMRLRILPQDDLTEFPDIPVHDGGLPDRDLSDVFALSAIGGRIGCAMTPPKSDDIMRYDLTDISSLESSIDELNRWSRPMPPMPAISKDEIESATLDLDRKRPNQACSIDTTLLEPTRLRPPPGVSIFSCSSSSESEDTLGTYGFTTELPQPPVSSDSTKRSGRQWTIPKRSRRDLHRCTNCGTKNSVTWRRSPFDADDILCNPCGLYAVGPRSRMC